MNTDSTKDELIDVILKDAHSQIQPPDSWESLRGRMMIGFTVDICLLPPLTALVKMLFSGVG